MADAIIHVFSRTSVTLDYSLPPEAFDAPPSEHELAVVVLDALDELRVLFEPLTAELRLACYDSDRFRWVPSLKPERRDWLLRTSLPPGVILAPLVVNPVISEVKALTREVLLSWIDEALGQECAAGSGGVGFKQLHFQVERVRIPDAERFEGQATIQVSSEYGEHEVPLERDGEGLWITAPLEFFAVIQPPLQLTVYNEDGGLSLCLAFHWSLWTEPGSLGRVAVEGAIARIEAKGWQRR